MVARRLFRPPQAGFKGRFYNRVIKSDLEKAGSEKAAVVVMSAPGGDRWSATALAQTLRERSRTDFHEGRIVNVDGWMLSLTETRVYALAALLSQSRSTMG